MTRRPNILMSVTDEERAAVPRPQGFSLPARERMAERGATFDRYYTASAMCSSARSVVYTGQYLPLTEIYDNDNMPSNAYVAPQNPGPTTNALEPYGFSEFNDWGDIDGGARAGLTLDPVIAGQAVRWLRHRAPLVEADQPWFMAVNFVNPHDKMSFDYGGSSQVPFRSASRTRSWPRRPPTSRSTSTAGTSTCPPASTTTCPARHRQWPSTHGCSTSSSAPSLTTGTGAKA
ncbi:hypothetical protein ACFWWM_40780 [Streptomyces sp. NPDC058682]|uniref:hypothetical protein n=1 Tax=Streptomyces sp. NPDC058682 TaxID=3346596 RepID=UPI003669EAF9